MLTASAYPQQILLTNKKGIFMAISETMALLKIMEIIATPGDDMSDGECIDQIIFILEELGMPIKEEIDAQLKLKNVQVEQNFTQRSTK